MDEFIKTLIDQMRCAKARDGVAREMSAHIIDQTNAYEKLGMEHDKAVEKAVREMGDPVEIGVSMDRIHRPQIDWRMILLALVLSIAGLFCMMPVYGVEQVLFGQGVFMLAGFAVIAVVYFIDYSAIGRFGVAAYIIMTILFWIGRYYMRTINGRIPAMSILVYLYVPVFAGILYQLRMMGYGGVIMGLVVIGVTCLVIAYFSATLWVIAMIGFSMVIMLLAAIKKGIFGGNKKHMTTIVAAIVLLSMTAMVLRISISWRWRSFRVMRLEAFFHRIQHGDDAGYIYNVIGDILRNAKFVGTGSSKYGDLPDLVISLDSGMAPLIGIYAYGFIAGILLLILLAALVFRAVKIVGGQKNQLGFLVSMACMLVIFLNVLEGILVNVGLFPYTSVIIPFLTRGGSVTFVYSVLIGLLLGVHRYERVYTMPTHAEQSKWKVSLKLEKR